MLRKDFNKIKKSVFVASLVHLSWLGRPITEHAYPLMVRAAGEVVQEQVQISAAKLQAGSNAVWMGMHAPVTQMRAAVKAGPGVVVENRATVGVSAWAIVMRSTAGRLALSKVSDGCRGQRVPASAQALTWNRRSVILHP